MKINFNVYEQRNWDCLKLETIKEINKQIDYCGAKNQSFIIDIKQDKTTKQMRGFHRLLSVIAYYLNDVTGEYWDIDNVKQLIKKQFGFITTYKGLEICKSCTKATKEEMMGLITTAEAFGAEMGIENCILKSEEKLEFENYYKLKDR